MIRHVKVRNLTSLFLFFLIALLGLSPAFGETFNIRDRIETQQFYYDVYPLIFGRIEIKDTKKFKGLLQELPKEKRQTALKFIKATDELLPNIFLKALVFYRFIEPNQEKLIKTLKFIFLQKLLVLRDAIDHPQTGNSQALENILTTMTEHRDVDTQNLYSVMSPLLLEKAQLIGEIDDHNAFLEALKNTKLFTFALSDFLSGKYHYTLSYLGLIEGNEVKVISENKVDLDRINWLNERAIFNGGIFDVEKPYIKMPMRPGDSGHIVFQEDPIFSQIRDMILEAQESIFIDIFLFGGTIGATISKFLIEHTLKKIKKNPNFKVLLLHDFATHYNMIDEMMPVFEYLKEARKQHPQLKKHFFLLQANIQRHPAGIPFGLTDHIHKTEESFPILEKHHTYYESKIDHSKVIVIDGNTLGPKAYFGSKNWTDHSGGYYYDDAFLVSGPAAALVQHSYYRDIEAALTLDKEEQKWFYFKEQGFDNKEYLKDGLRDHILNSFKVTTNEVPLVGRQTLRLAEADVDGTVKNTRNILIDMIMKAQKTIHMEQLFLYDKYVVDALIKKKIDSPEIKIRILLDHNGNFGMNGLPNTIFIKEMAKYGIEVRARKTFGVKAKFPNGMTQEYHQENHRKMTCVDGKVLLGGSSNINPDTLQGSFREFGAQVFSFSEGNQFDQRFLSDWNDPEKVSVLDIENFQAKIGGKILSKKTSDLINDIAAQLLRSKDLLEKRY